MPVTVTLDWFVTKSDVSASSVSDDTASMVTLGTSFATVSSVSVSVAVAVLPAASVTVAVTVIVPSLRLVRSTSDTTQASPTFVAERTIAGAGLGSSIETETLAASASTPASVRLTCEASDALVTSSEVAKLTAKVSPASSALSSSV